MNHAVAAALQSPEVRARFIPQGIDPMGGSRADFVKFLASEKGRLEPIVRAVHMQED